MSLTHWPVKKLRSILILLAILVVSGLFFLIGTSAEPAFYLAALSWILGVTLLLWLGNRYISIWLNAYYPWADYDQRRFFAQIFLSTVYSLVCVNLTYYLIKSQFLGFPPDQEQMLLLNMYGLLLIIPVISIHFGVFFMMRWKKNFTYSQELQSKNLKSQFESLKNHLDPHFLFNNLNILSSLIDKDPATAQEFLEHFSDVYRYVLRTKNEELVSLETELEFIDSYLFMLKIRFMQQLQIHIRVSSDFRKYFIPPLSVQTLIENAMKHNKATDAEPLIIEIFTEARGYLVVQNNFHPKKSEGYSAQTGLNNLAKRYEYVANAGPEIIKSTTHFVVKLPLILFEENNARTNY